MQVLLNRIFGDGNFTWQDAPCEMSRLFVDKVNNFLKDHILCSKNPLLGKVKHWTLRFESQVGIVEGEARCCDAACGVAEGVACSL
jgi:hypothetical protein